LSGSAFEEVLPELPQIEGILAGGLDESEDVLLGKVGLEVFEAGLEVVLVDDLVLVGVEQLKQFVYLFVHVLVLDDAAWASSYMEMMARNSESRTWLKSGESLPVYLMSCTTSSRVTRSCIELRISNTDSEEMYPRL
jgi:hypothetical protein